MLTVGLTGGIGSGKSTFASLLERRGAEVIDADALGRVALEPGSPSWHSVVAQFGDEILAPGMEIDRRRLAEIVFASSEALAALNAIVHPVILQRIAETLEMLSGTDEIVVVDAALIVEIGLAESVDLLVVVEADEDVRRRRLANERGMSLEDIDARIKSQAHPDDLSRRADILVRNDGSLDDLEAEADRVWAELTRFQSPT